MRITQLLLFFFAFSSFAIGQSTKLIVRAKAKDAKFIGTSVGGAMVLIKNADTGELLTSGLTQGSTGNTSLIMKTPYNRYDQIADENTAKFEANLDISEPTFVTIEVKSPYSNRQATVLASTQIWVIPGKDITGDGIVLEIPGFIIDILEPQTHRFQSKDRLKEGYLGIKANIVMMCGCTISDGGLWDGSDMEVKALIKKGGKLVEEVDMQITPTSNIFAGKVKLEETGPYEITVYAYDAKTGNTGLDRLNFVLTD